MKAYYRLVIYNENVHWFSLSVFGKVFPGEKGKRTKKQLNKIRTCAQIFHDTKKSLQEYCIYKRQRGRDKEVYEHVYKRTE